MLENKKKSIMIKELMYVEECLPEGPLCRLAGQAFSAAVFCKLAAKSAIQDV